MCVWKKKRNQDEPFIVFLILTLETPFINQKAEFSGVAVNRAPRSSCCSFSLQDDNKLEVKIENWIQKYDEEMEEKQVGFLHASAPAAV